MLLNCPPQFCLLLKGATSKSISGLSTLESCCTLTIPYGKGNNYTDISYVYTSPYWVFTGLVVSVKIMALTKIVKLVKFWSVDEALLPAFFSWTISAKTAISRVYYCHGTFWWGGERSLQLEWDYWFISYKTQASNRLRWLWPNSENQSL